MMRNDTRAVSDTVAFVLMFSVIIMSVGAVSIAGINELTELKDEERLTSAERNMEATAAQMDKIHRQGDPYRTFAIPLHGGNVWVQNSTMNVTANETTLDNEIGGNYTVRSLNHQFDKNPYDVTVAYESGGSFRTSEISQGIVARYPPSWRCEDDAAIISMVRLEPDDQINIGGGYNDDFVIGPNTDIPRESPIAEFEQGLQLEAELNRTETSFESISNGETVNVTVDPQYTAQPQEWQRYLGTNDEWVQNGTRYTCTINGTNDGSVMVKETVIDISV